MMKIKIALLISTLERSGPSGVLLNLVKYLDSRFIPEIVTLSPEPAASRINDFESIGVKVHTLNLSRLKWYLGGQKSLKNLLQKIEPAIIHSHSLRPDLVAARSFPEFKRVSTIHANLEIAYSDTYGSWAGKRMAASQVKAIQKAEMKVACSRSVYSHYEKTIADLRCIPNGVDTAIFKPSEPGEKEILRRKLGLPLDKKLFLSVGALTTLKDPLTVMKAFVSSNVATRAKLVMIGKGPLEAEVKTFAESNGIIYLGFQSQLRQYYAACDYFVSASTSEGLPNTVLEALACGLPVCLSDIPAHMELAGGLTWRFNFLTGSVSSASEAMERAFAKSYNELSGDALKLAINKYSARRMAEEYGKLYDYLVNHS